MEGFEIVSIHSILYCEAVDNFTRFFFENSQPLLICRTLKYFEEILRVSPFFQDSPVIPHKSQLCDPLLQRKRRICNDEEQSGA